MSPATASTALPGSPSPSLSRATGKRSLRTTESSDTLSTHPLLASPNGGSTFELVPGSSTGPYPVYTGRSAKRLSATAGEAPPVHAAASSTSTSTPPAPTAAPTSLPPLISRPSSSPLPTVVRPPARSVSEATRSLLGQRIKADVQSLGLGTDSAGAAMVTKLAGLGKEVEWTGVLAALGTGKIMLLLPAEKLPSPAFLTPAFYLDHLAVLEVPGPSAATGSRAFATLSGLRGHIDTESIYVISCGTAISESPSGMFKPGTLGTAPFADLDFHRAVSGAASPSFPSSPFPTFSLVSLPSELSIPRTSSRTTPAPNPDRRMESIGRAVGSTGSRLSALFAKSTPSPTPPLDDLPPIVPAPPGLLSPDPASDSTDPSSTLPSTPRSSTPNLEITVLAIDKILRHSELVKDVTRALDLFLRSSLHDISPAVVIDQVAAFAARFQPPLGWTSSLVSPGRFPAAPDSLFTKDVEDVSDALQDMMQGVRETLVGSGEKEDEEHVDAAMERIEEVLTVALYDRLFSPAASGDAQADENLSSRIAALNILELSLDHLGVDLGDGGEWSDGRRTVRDRVEDVIGLAAKELARLQEDTVRSPAKKLAVFVNVHKIIVEGLSKLPNIPLKESTDDSPFTVRKSSINSAEVEMDDVADRTGTSRSHSPVGDQDESSFRTPRAPTFDLRAGVPDLVLPPTSTANSSPSLNSELASSMSEAMGSIFDVAPPSSDVTPPSVFDVTPRRDPAPASTSSSSADLILPLLIYLVVQYNPRHLPSTLHYIQRFRSHSLLRGEASYCITNLDAVASFLNTIDVSALGLSSKNVMGRPYLPEPSAPAGGAPRTTLLKGRVTNVTHELDHFVDSANSALVSVVDSSFRILFGPRSFADKTIEDVKNALDGAGSKARGTLLRRGTGASGIGGGGDGTGVGAGVLGEGVQREMVDISGSGGVAPEEEADDAGSVRSFASLGRREASGAGDADGRPSIGERLSSIFATGEAKGTGGLTAASLSSTPVKSSLLSASTPPTRRATVSSHVGDIPQVQPGSVRPVQRFLECDVGDLRIGEVGDLLAEYRKLAAELERLSGGGDAGPV